MYDDILVAKLDNYPTVKYQNEYYSIDNLEEFMLDRIPSPNRSDIETILFRMGLKEYNIFNLALKTRMINPMDKYWIRVESNETFEHMLKKFLSQDMIEQYSPSGNNIKSYYYHKGKFGIRKKRLAPVILDNESEIMSYRLADLLGVSCCPCEKLDEDWIFSEYMYDFNKTDFSHVRRSTKLRKDGDLYKSLIETYPHLTKDINKMILFDFITRQDDRHMSNIAVYNNSTEFYPLYDNGRSLFFEDREDFIETAISDPITYCTTFGENGTYWDHILLISETTNISDLINLNIDKNKIKEIFDDLDLTDNRKSRIETWITKTVELLKELSNTGIR